MAIAQKTQLTLVEQTDFDALQRQIRLFEQEAVANLMLDAVPDAFVILNNNQQIVYANERLETMLGDRDREMAYGQQLSNVLGCIHLAETTSGCGTTPACGHCGAFKAVVASMARRTAVQECRIATHTGDALDLRVWTRPLPIGGEQFIMLVMQDISHEKRRQALERVFFHDILNSAGFITGLLDTVALSEADGDPIDLNQFRDALDSAARRIVDEVQHHRLISVAEADNLAVNWQMIDIPSYLERTFRGVERNSYAHDKHFVVEPGDALALRTDPVLLGRVLLNMVKNALEASAPGGTVMLSVAPEGEQITFSVHNETYMPHHVQLQVFKRSFSTKGSGRGLGTYSMKLFTERYLGGAIGFTSSPADGTIFYARFPLT